MAFACLSLTSSSRSVLPHLCTARDTGWFVHGICRSAFRLSAVATKSGGAVPRPRWGWCVGKSLYGCHAARKPLDGLMSLGGLFRSVPGLGACHLGATRSLSGLTMRSAADADALEEDAGADARRSKDATRGSHGCGCAKRDVDSPPRSPSIGLRGERAVAKWGSRASETFHTAPPVKNAHEK